MRPLEPTRPLEPSAMTPIDRRQFLRSSAAVAAGLSVLEATAIVAGDDVPKDTKKTGPNEILRVAVLGVRGRGLEHLDGWFKQEDARVTTVCDVDQRVIGRAMERVEKKYGAAPKF